MRPDSVYEMADGYELQVNWSVYPEAQVVKDGTIIGGKSWVLTGALFTHFRIQHWALKTVRRHERMKDDLARPLRSAKGKT